jgi:hypothetical protein
MNTTAAAIAAGLVECRTCGHRAVQPEPHNAVMQIRCPEADGWGPPTLRPWEQPKVPYAGTVFVPPPKQKRWNWRAELEKQAAKERGS